MTSQEFRFWLDGYLSDKKELTLEQIEFVQNKMDAVKDKPLELNPIVPLHPTLTPTDPNLNPPYNPTCPYPTPSKDVWYTNSTSMSTNNNLNEEMDIEDMGPK